MGNLDVQRRYWDDVAEKKTFALPICMGVLRELVSLEEAVLDYGCGYGRTCSELSECGYRKVVGIDISSQMIARGRVLYPSVEFVHFDGRRLPFADESFAACALLAVLTCIPTNGGQRQAIDEIHRVLRPDGLLYISDYPIQVDTRNQQRYRQYEDEFGIHGVFRLPDGGVVRHHDRRWISELLSAFTLVREDHVEVRTMNGNVAEAFRLAVRKADAGQRRAGIRQ